MEKIKLNIFVCLLALVTSVTAQINGTYKFLYSTPATSGVNVGVTTLDDIKGYVNLGATAGTVTSVTMTPANGFTGAFSNSTTTPMLTVGTSVTGLLKGDGTALSAATAGTDYVIPSGSITGNAATSTLASNVTTNADMVGVVTSTGNTTSIAPNAITDAMVAGISGSKVTGTVANTNLVGGGAITVNGISVPLGGSTSLGLQETTTQNSSTTIASTFFGGLTSSSSTTIAGQYNVVPSSTSTGSTLTIGAGVVKQPINSTATTTVTVTSGIAGFPEIKLPLLSTSTGSVVITSSGSETFNGNSTFTIAANSQNYTIHLEKISATGWTVVLN